MICGPSASHVNQCNISALCIQPVLYVHVILKFCIPLRPSGAFYHSKTTVLGFLVTSLEISFNVN
jgi:hypothetical protein